MPLSESRQDNARIRFFDRDPNAEHFVIVIVQNELTPVLVSENMPDGAVPGSPLSPFMPVNAVD